MKGQVFANGLWQERPFIAGISELILSQTNIDSSLGLLSASAASYSVRPESKIKLVLSAQSTLLCPLTFVAVSNGVKVHIVLLVGKEEKAEPGVKGIDRDNEENPHDMPLLIWGAVVTQVHVDLREQRGKHQPRCDKGIQMFIAIHHSFGSTWCRSVNKAPVNIFLS